MSECFFTVKSIFYDVRKLLTTTDKTLGSSARPLSFSSSYSSPTVHTDACGHHHEKKRTIENQKSDSAVQSPLFSPTRIHHTAEPLLSTRETEGRKEEGGSAAPPSASVRNETTELPLKGRAEPAAITCLFHLLSVITAETYHIKGQHQILARMAQEEDATREERDKACLVYHTQIQKQQHQLEELARLRARTKAALDRFLLGQPSPHASRAPEEDEEEDNEAIREKDVETKAMDAVQMERDLCQWLTQVSTQCLHHATVAAAAAAAPPPVEVPAVVAALLASSSSSFSTSFSPAATTAALSTSHQPLAIGPTTHKPITAPSMGVLPCSVSDWSDGYNHLTLCDESSELAAEGERRASHVEVDAPFLKQLQTLAEDVQRRPGTGKEDKATALQKCATSGAPTEPLPAQRPPLPPTATAAAGAPREPRTSVCRTVHYLPRSEQGYTAAQWAQRAAMVRRSATLKQLARTVCMADYHAVDIHVETVAVPPSSGVPPLWVGKFYLLFDTPHRVCREATPTGPPPPTEVAPLLPDLIASASTAEACHMAGGRCLFACVVVETPACPRKVKAKRTAVYLAAEMLLPAELQLFCSKKQLSGALAAREDDNDRSSPRTSPRRPASFAEQAVALLQTAHRGHSAAAPRLVWEMEAQPGAPFTLYGAAVTDTTTGSLTAVVTGSHVVQTLQRALVSTAQLFGVPSIGVDALWLEFLAHAAAAAPHCHCSNDFVVYLFNHFFGVPPGQTAALLVDTTTVDGNARQATVRLRYCPTHAGTVTVATAVALTAAAARDLALRQACVRNFGPFLEQQCASGSEPLRSFAREIRHDGGWPPDSAATSGAVTPGRSDHVHTPMSAVSATTSSPALSTGLCTWPPPGAWAMSAGIVTDRSVEPVTLSSTYAGDVVGDSHSGSSHAASRGAEAAICPVRSYSAPVLSPTWTVSAPSVKDTTPAVATATSVDANAYECWRNAWIKDTE